MNPTPRISFYTLGCKLNQAETAALQNAAEKNGYRLVSFREPADVMVVNSCTVTNRADRKTRQALFQARRRSPDGIVVLAGCFPQVNSDSSTEIPGVDIILGTRDKFDLYSAIADFKKTRTRHVRISSVDNRKRLSSAFIAATDRTRAYLKIQEGCNNFCTYCIVPYTRGNPVSRDFDNTITEARELANAGYKEIVLSGIDIGAYADSGKRLIDVLRALEDISDITGIPGIERIRISSIEMNTLSDDLIKHIGISTKIMPHFHLSLQSGSDVILKSMKRKYSTADFSTKVETIRKYIPEASIGTDVIVGFPGETDALFEETVAHINKMRFSYLHVFRYSARKGTPAANMKDQIPESVKRQRAKVLNNVDSRLRRSYAVSFYGTTQPVLWERYKNNLLYGLTPHYIQVQYPARINRHNTISKIVLDKNNIVF